MKEIEYREKDSDSWMWCANVVDRKAQSFVERKNKLFDRGEWRICLKE